MKYKYKFNELDCANCANAIEQKLNSDKNIKTASVNFSKLSLIVETDLDKDVKKYVNNIINILEPILIVVILVVVTSYLIDNSYNPFLYFRF